MRAATWAKLPAGVTTGAGGYINLDFVQEILVVSVNGTDWFISAGTGSIGVNLNGVWTSSADALTALDKLLAIEGGTVDPSTL